jgi:MPBQ/MSBQ methyltransferase
VSTVPAGPPWLIPLVLFVIGVVLVGAWLWLFSARRYRGSQSVAEAYDRWTQDALLERLWGDHVHLGHYGDPAGQRDFRQAKADFVHELVHWSGLDQLPPGSTVLDVGCGMCSPSA